VAFVDAVAVGAVFHGAISWVIAGGASTGWLQGGSSPSCEGRIGIHLVESPETLSYGSPSEQLIDAVTFKDREPEETGTLALLPQVIAEVELALARHRGRKDRSLTWALEEAHLVDRLVAARASILHAAETKHRDQLGQARLPL
jgi:hypothetical protein